MPRSNGSICPSLAGPARDGKLSQWRRPVKISAKVPAMSDQNEQEYRTLMLEPQWHPILWIKDRCDLKDLVFYLLVFDLFAPILAAAPAPEKMAVWSIGRWVLFGITVSPLLCLICFLVVCLIKLVLSAPRWLYHHPPVKIRTNYRSK